MRREMSSAQRQSGVTLIGWIIIIALVVFVATIVIRLFPLYLEHFSVTSSLNSLATDAELKGASPGEIRSSLMRRLGINSVDRVGSEDIEIVRATSGGYEVRVSYQVQVPFVHNIEFLVSFDDTVEVGAR